MAKKIRKLLFIAIILTALLSSSAYATIVPNVHAEETTIQEKGLTILNEVVGLEMAKYATASKESPQDLYQGILPQEHVCYTLKSDGSKLKMDCIFTNGTLQTIDVLEHEGTPHMTKSSTNTLEMASDFLSDYQTYSGNSLYGELKSMLDNVDISENSTKTFGNMKLKVTNTQDAVTFTWVYSINGVDAGSKFVSLRLENGFLKSFVDHWKIHKIGSTKIDLSEEEAIAIAIEYAKTYQWSVSLDTDTLGSEKFNESNVRWVVLFFGSSLRADKTRNEDLLTLYPVWRVGIGLDKWYGNLYGIEVDIWADTKEVRCVHEAWSSMDQSLLSSLYANESSIGSTDEGIPFAENSTSNQSPSQQLQSEAEAVTDLIPSEWMALTALISVLAAATIFWYRKKKPSSKLSNSPKIRSSKTNAVLLCLLISSAIFFLPISTVQADIPNPKGGAVIWGSKSIGCVVPPDYNNTRKSPEERNAQTQYSYLFSDYFSDNGYDDYNHQGSMSTKSNILSDIVIMQADYHRVAVVDFDHGVFRDDYSQAPGEVHYMFEDNVGIDYSYGYPPTNQHSIDNNFVFDMDIYDKTSFFDPSKYFFALINTCLSANLTYAHGMGQYGAVGMPFAWAHRIVGTNMSEDGYQYPDNDLLYCFIGFTWGSASLSQTVNDTQRGIYDVTYGEWLEDFFWSALYTERTVNQALNYASEQNYQGAAFSSCVLRTGFTADWWTLGTSDNCHMVVFGNGNIYLHSYSFTVVAKDQYDNEFANKDVYIDSPYNIANTGTSMKVTGGLHPFYVNDFWETSGGQCTGNRCTFYYWQPEPGWKIYYQPYEWDFDEDFTMTVYFDKQYCPGDVNGDGDRDPNDLDAFSDAYPSTRGSSPYNYNSTCDFDGDGDVDGGDRAYLYNLFKKADYPLDEGYCILVHDSTDYGNDGIVYGGASWVPGMSDSALYFDGVNDYVNVPDSNSLDIADAITIETWVNLYADHTDWSATMIRKDGSFSLEFGDAGNNKPSFLLWLTSGSARLDGPEIPKFGWHHLAATYDGSYMRLYIDGDEVESCSASNTIATSANSLRIGRWGSEWFNGKVDEVHIYDRALSEDEIEDSYESLLPHHQLTVYCWELIFEEQIEEEISINDGEYWDGYGYLSESVPEGEYKIEVSQNYAYFQYFDDGSTYYYDNPVEIMVTSDMTIVAVYIVG